MIRSRPMRWLMIGFGALCLLAAVPLAITGSGDERGAALTVMGPFGLVMLLVGRIGPHERGSRAGIQRRPVGDEMATVVGMDAHRARMALLICLAFTLAGAGFVLFPGAFDEDPALLRFVGGACALVFGTMTLAGWRGIRSPVVLYEDRLAYRGAEVAWRDITETSILSMYGTEMLGIRAERVRMSALAHLLRPLNRKLSRADFAIPLNGVACDPDELRELIRERIAATSA